MLFPRTKGLAGLVGLLAVAGTLAGSLSAQSPTPPDSALFFRQYAPGLLARITYQADSTGPYRVAIWDLLIGPGKSSDSTTLPGGAVFEVRSGSGRIVLDGKASEIRSGATVVVHQGSRFSLINGRQDAALAIRATVVQWTGP